MWRGGQPRRAHSDAAPRARRAPARVEDVVASPELRPRSAVPRTGSFRDYRCCLTRTTADREYATPNTEPRGFQLSCSRRVQFVYSNASSRDAPCRQRGSSCCARVSAEGLGGHVRHSHKRIREQHLGIAVTPALRGKRLQEHDDALLECKRQAKWDRMDNTRQLAAQARAGDMLCSLRTTSTDRYPPGSPS
jgi:hypothetical protein